MTDNEIIKQYLSWLETTLKDRDLLPIEYATFLQCWSKLHVMIKEENKK